MATLVMATAAGAAAVLYYTGWTETIALPWPLAGSKALPPPPEDSGSEEAEQRLERLRRIRLQLRRPSKPPATWSEALSMLAEALSFTYSETLGKWPIHHLAFGINYMLHRQGQLQVAGVYAGEGSVRLRGRGVVQELQELRRLIRMCYLFSKKTFEVFLQETGFKKEDVLLYEAKAALLKPAFAVVLDHSRRQVLLIVRGTHSMKDTLTVVTGAVVPFHHTLLDGSGVRHVVLGYAHCGMAAAARFIAHVAEPVLREALEKQPGYRVKVIGHSLGGGTAALLTFALREKAGFRDITCSAFAPAACMTWELAESGGACVTSVVNGADVVPTFSAASADGLRAEVTASAWVKDLQEQMEQMRILRLVVSSAAVLRRRLSSLGAATYSMSSRASRGLHSTRAEMGRLLQPSLSMTRAGGALASGTQVVMRGVQTMVRTPPALGLPPWNCMGERRRGLAGTFAPVEEEGEARAQGEEGSATDPSAMRMERGPDAQGLAEAEAEAEEAAAEEEAARLERASWKAGRAQRSDSEDAAGLAALLDALHREPEEQGGRIDDDGDSPGMEQRGEGGMQAEYSWEELEAELARKLDSASPPNEEEQAAAREITREEEEVASHATSAEIAEREGEEVDDFLRDPRRFFPCGRIVHLVRRDPLGSPREEVEEEGSGSAEEDADDEWSIGAFLTDRSLYGRVHLSRAMVVDHFMPNYMKAMQEIMDELEKELPQDDGLAVAEDVEGPQDKQKLS